MPNAPDLEAIEVYPRNTDKMTVDMKATQWQISGLWRTWRVAGLLTFMVVFLFWGLLRTPRAYDDTSLVQTISKPGTPVQVVENTLPIPPLPEAIPAPSGPGLDQTLEPPAPAPDSNSASEKASTESPKKEKDRPLVLFMYAESSSARPNLEFFIAQGLNGAADFVFVFNGETNDTKLVPTDLPNVQVVERPNECFDLGSIGQVLMKDDLWKKYTKFITINASVRGPFLPSWENGCWMDKLLGKITEKVKLVGTTMNCFPRQHVQSMMLVTDSIGMSILLDPALAHILQEEDGWGGKDDVTGFSECYPSYRQTIHGEIGLTKLIRSQGYEVDAMMSSVSAQAVKEYCVVNDNPYDPLLENGYFGANVHPYEVVFMKTNRDINPTVVDNLTKWHLERNRTSWETCGREYIG